MKGVSRWTRLTVLARREAADRREVSEPYRQGWFDGRCEEAADFTENVRLARWDDPEDRLEYYRGHRAGSRGWFEAAEMRRAA